VEGGARSLFRQRLQPIELAKAAARAMDRQRLIGPEGIEVPNAFEVVLHPRELEQLASYQASLEATISRYLSSFAEERGLVPVAPISVMLVADDQLRRRTVRVVARMADPSAGPATRPVVLTDATELLPRVHLPAAPSAANDSLVLLLEDGRQVPIPDGLLRIGRALDNDLVIADSRVSRYHAQIVRGADGSVVRDLGSTNGTALAGRVVSEGRLADGDQLTLGGYRIGVHRERPVSPGRP
jgi:hypothetical protein